jgi:hypothetical protein
MSRQPGTPSLAPDSVLAQRSSLTSFTSIPSLRCPFRTSVTTVPLGRAQADLCRIPRPLAHASGVCPVWSLFLGLLPKSAILHLCRAFTSARSSGRRGRSPSAFAPATRSAGRYMFRAACRRVRDRVSERRPQGGRTARRRSAICC